MKSYLVHPHANYTESLRRAWLCGSSLSARPIFLVISYEACVQHFALEIKLPMWQTLAHLESPTVPFGKVPTDTCRFLPSLAPVLG